VKGKRRYGEGEGEGRNGEAKEEKEGLE